mgnify:FL=1
MTKIIRTHPDYNNEVVTTVTGQIFRKKSELGKDYNEKLEETDLEKYDEVRSYLKQGILMIVDVDEENEKSSVVSTEKHLPNEDDETTMKEVISQENDEEMKEAKANATEEKDNDEIIEELEEADDEDGGDED